MTIEQWVKGLEYTLLQGSLDTKVNDLVYDSRKAKKDSVFVCISGSVSDGHTYIEDVIAKGASVIVVEKEVQPVPGVTYLKVPDSRLALAQLPAAYPAYPARKFNTRGIP